MFCWTLWNTMQRVGWSLLAWSYIADDALNLVPREIKHMDKLI